MFPCISAKGIHSSRSGKNNIVILYLDIETYLYEFDSNVHIRFFYAIQKKYYIFYKYG